MAREDRRNIWEVFGGEDFKAREIRQPMPTLHAAVESGLYGRVADLLDSKAVDVNAMNAEGLTPLHVAAKYGRNDIFRCLLKHGANPQIRDIYGHLAINYLRGDGKQLATPGPHPLYQIQKRHMAMPPSNVPAGNIFDNLRQNPHIVPMATIPSDNNESPLDLSSGSSRDGPMDLTLKKTKTVIESDDSDDDVIVVGESLPPKSQNIAQRYSRDYSKLYPMERERYCSQIRNSSNDKVISNASRYRTVPSPISSSVSQRSDFTRRTICTVRPQLSVTDSSSSAYLQPQYSSAMTSYYAPSSQQSNYSTHGRASLTPRASIPVNAHSSNIPSSHVSSSQRAPFPRYPGHYRIRQHTPPAKQQVIPPAAVTGHKTYDPAIRFQSASIQARHPQLSCSNFISEDNRGSNTDANTKKDLPLSISAKSSAIVEKELRLARALHGQEHHQRDTHIPVSCVRMEGSILRHSRQMATDKCHYVLGHVSQVVKNDIQKSLSEQPTHNNTQVAIDTVPSSTLRQSTQPQKCVPVANVNPIVMSNSQYKPSAVTSSSNLHSSPAEDEHSTQLKHVSHIEEIVHSKQNFSAALKTSSFEYSLAQSSENIAQAKKNNETVLTKHSKPENVLKARVENTQHGRNIFHHYNSDVMKETTDNVHMKAESVKEHRQQLKSPVSTSETGCCNTIKSSGIFSPPITSQSYPSINTRDFSLQFAKTFGKADSEFVRKLEHAVCDSQTKDDNSAPTAVESVKYENVPVATKPQLEDKILIKPEVVSQIVQTVKIKTEISEIPLFKEAEIQNVNTKQENMYQEKPSNISFGIKRPLALPAKLARKKRKFSFENCMGKDMFVDYVKVTKPDIVIKPSGMSAKFDRKKHVLHRFRIASSVTSKSKSTSSKHQIGQIKKRCNPRLLNEIANSDGFVPEEKRYRGYSPPESLFDDPVKLDREEKKLQRAIMQFSKLEGKNLEINKEQKGKTYEDAFNSFLQSNSNFNIDMSPEAIHKKFVDFHPEILPTRTRTQTASTKTGRPRAAYNKYAAYEVELEKEEARKQLRRQIRKREREEERKRRREKKQKLEVESNASFAPGTSIIPDPRSKELLEKIKEKERLKTARRRFMPRSIHHKKKMKRLRKQRLKAMHAPTITPLTDEQEDGKKKKDPFSVYKSCGETILHRAARLGYSDVVTDCLASGEVDVNAKDNAGFTPLHECCVKGFVEIAEVLLQYGADVNCSSSEGIRPIHDAVENDHLLLARLLLQHGADPLLGTYSGQTPLTIANTTNMKAFIQGCIADINGAIEEGQEIVPLHLPGPFENEFCDFLQEVPKNDEPEAAELYFSLRKNDIAKHGVKRIVRYFSQLS